MKNLVLGVAKGYGRNDLEPFVTSFTRNCRSAELILFVDDISEFTRERLIAAGVLLKTFPDEMKRGIPNNTRRKIFSDYLETHGNAYEQIFITDTRDVIFQSDVFEPFKKFRGYLGYTTEADVIGAVNEMKIFCRTMWEALKCETIWGHKQAIMNYLVHKNLLPIENLIEIDIDGEIFTMGLTDDFSVSGEKILRGGRVPAAVHQYNRHESLIGLIDEIYHDKNFQADVRFNDMRSVAEQATCLLFANKIVDAAKFFMKKFLVTADFNGCDKALIRLWEIAMKNPLSPASELIELSAQSALRSFKKFFDSEWEKICVLLNYAAEYRRPVDPEFKIYVMTPLFKLAKEKFLAGEREQYLSYIEMIVSIEGGEISWRRN